MNSKTIVFPMIQNSELQEHLKLKGEMREKVKYYSQFVCRNEEHDHVSATMESCIK